MFTPISETLVSATPLILAGTGVALGFSTGVFNIGGQGQFIAGALAATYVGFGVHLPIGIHLPLVILAGAAGGAVAGFIPGILKARTGAHEVIVTIMLNYVFLYLLNYLLTTAPLCSSRARATPSPRRSPGSARLPQLFGSGLRVNLGFIVALAVAAGGVVAHAQEHPRLRVQSGRCQPVGRPDGGHRRPAGDHTGPHHIWRPGRYGRDVDAGRHGLLPLQRLRRRQRLQCHHGGATGPQPAPGVVLGSLLFAALSTGGRYMQSTTWIPLDLTSVIQAVIVFLVATPALVRGDLPPARSRGRQDTALHQGVGRMSVVPWPPRPAELAPEGRIVSGARVRGMGVFLLLLAVIMFGPFGLGVPAHVHATFLLGAPPATGVSPLSLPVRWVSVPWRLVCAALAGICGYGPTAAGVTCCSASG